MAKDLNQCNFIGRLGNDVETRYLPTGKAVANISIAVGESWKDQQGQKQERTEWVRVTAFDKLAEIMAQYLRKGSKVYVSGKMRTTKFTGQDGVEKYSTEIVANDMQMLDSKPEGQNAAPQQQAPRQQPAPQRQQPAQTMEDDFSDDIPF